MIQHFTSSNPELIWEKLLCEFCSGPTGKGSCCEDTPKSERVAEVITVNGQIKRIYTPNCYFKTMNLWKAHVNFPVSRSLCETLLEIPGLDGLIPNNPYGFIIEIAMAFDENVVKKNVVTAFKAFIKGKQALLSTKNDLLSKNIVVFPNGSQFVATTDADRLIAQELKQMFGNVYTTGNL